MSAAVDTVTGSAAPAGRASLAPGRIKLLAVSLLTARRSGSETLYNLAMPARKSPDLTVCVKPDAGVDGVVVAASLAAGTALAGRASCWPGKIRLFAVRLLTASRSGNVTLCRFAIEPRNSPDLTVWSSDPAVAEAGVRAGAGGVAPAGTINLSPGTMTLLVFRLLAVNNCGKDTPTLAAIPARKSPGTTTYTGPPAGLAGAANAGAGRLTVLSEIAETAAANRTR